MRASLILGTRQICLLNVWEIIIKFCVAFKTIVSKTFGTFCCKKDKVPHNIN